MISTPILDQDPIRGNGAARRAAVVNTDDMDPIRSGAAVPPADSLNYMEEDLPAADVTDEHLEKLIPPEPAVPDEKEVRDLAAVRLQRDLDRGGEIQHAQDEYTVKLRPQLEIGRKIRARIHTRQKVDRDNYRAKRVPLVRKWRSIKEEVKRAETQLATSHNKFHATLKAGGFDPQVTPDIQGIEETIRRRPEVCLLAPDDTPAPAETIAPAADALPQMPACLPLPAKPTNHGHEPLGRAGLLELVVSAFLALIIGSVFGAAIASGMGIASISDLIALRSVPGALFTLVLGPVLLFAAGEGWKKVAKEAVLLGHSQVTRTPQSTFVLQTLMAVLVLFSIGDISVTAGLFRQAAAENTTDIWGTGPTTPLLLFWIEGLLVTSPLLVGKAFLGRSRGLQLCEEWDHYADSRSQVEQTNQSIQADYQAAQADYQADRQRWDAEQQRLLAEQDDRVTRQRDQSQLRDKLISSIRQTNTAICDAVAILDEITMARHDRDQIKANEAEVRGQITHLEADLAPSPAERKELAEADLAVMQTMNAIYKGLCGSQAVFFDEAAMRPLTAALDGAPMPAPASAQ